MSRLSLALVGLVAATAVLAAPVAKPKSVSAPEDEEARPAPRGGDARNRAASLKNLEKIALDTYEYGDANGSVLPADITGKDGKRLLSWRVVILPYLQEKERPLAPPTPGAARPETQAGKLFKRFKLNEPWDSKHNLALLREMPPVYASPRVTLKQKGNTVYQVFSGPGALFQAGKSKYKLANIPDGTSNTLFAVEASRAVPWTKPADIPYDADKALPDLGKAYGGKPAAALMDGSTRLLDLKKISVGTLRNAICPDDGNVLGADWQP